MLITSAAIPPLAIWHRLRGEINVRRADRQPPEQRPEGRSVRPGRDVDRQCALPDRPRTASSPYPVPARRWPPCGAVGIAVGVVSNQSGVARGLITPDELASVNARVESLLGPFDTWQVCVHGPTRTPAAAASQRPEWWWRRPTTSAFPRATAS